MYVPLTQTKAGNHQEFLRYSKPVSGIKQGSSKTRNDFILCKHVPDLH